MMQTTAKAHTNIALIKYWGKRDETLILPTNNSLSLTLDGFYTKTTVTFKEELEEYIFSLYNELISGDQYRRVTVLLDLIREYAGKPNLYAEINSMNEVPTAAGFASSASGFAALAAAATKSLGLTLTEQELSRLRSEEHTSELQSRGHLVCRLLLEKKNTTLSFR